MPRTKIESLVVTAITAWIMVYIMTLYNKILVTKHFLNSIPKGHPLIHVLRTGGGMLIDTMKEMWIEYIIIFLCAFFISSHIAKYFASFYSHSTSCFCQHFGNISWIWI